MNFYFCYYKYKFLLVNYFNLIKVMVKIDKIDKDNLDLYFRN